jgi:hypothetical protein
MMYHSFEMALAGATTFKKRYLWTIALVALWVAVHVVLRSVSPSFAQGPPGTARSPISRLFRLEWLGHFVVFGIAVTAIRNRVGWWRKPTYGDEGLLSIENAAKLEGSSYEVLPTRWNDIGWIVGGVLIYALLWAWILLH